MNFKLTSSFYYDSVLLFKIIDLLLKITIGKQPCITEISQVRKCDILYALCIQLPNSEA